MKLILLLMTLGLINCGGGDGSDGAPGISIEGEDGEDGQDGTAGASGENGADGEDGVAVNTNWIDPISGFEWSIGSTAIYSTAQTACTGSWRMGTSTEVVAAAMHGLDTAANYLSGPDTAWTSTIVDGANSQSVTLATAVSASTSNASARGVFCLLE